MSLAANALFAQTAPLSVPAKGAPKPGKQEEDPARPADSVSLTAGRTQLNLLGQADTDSGESRRNENVKFNPIDNNTLREVNIRIGTTATLVEQFEPSGNYFSSEFGSRPDLPIHLVGGPATAIHGSLFATHNNSIFTARSFFQAGDVKPARENNYGFTLGLPLWSGARISLDAGQQKVRGSVNGNVLVPNANERTPLTTDPEIRPIVQRYLASYPAELPNRTDIDDRALNTNSPQEINTDRIAGTLDQLLGQRSHLLFRYALTAQQTQSFQFVAGQNPDSVVRAHSARITWNRVWNPSTVADLTLGFDRTGTVLRPESRAVTPFISIFIIQRTGSPTIPVDRALNDFRYAGQIRQTRGRHNWSAGGGLLRRQFNGQESNDHLGTFYFGDTPERNAVDNLRMGTPLRYTIAIGNTARGFRNWEFAGFAGDHWQAARGLSVYYGVRYEFVTRPLEVNNLDVVPFGCDCNNFAPSLGFAYQLPGKSGVLRAAYATHFGRIFPVTYGQVRFNPPGNFNLNVDSPNMAHPLQGIDVGAIPPGIRTGLISISPDLVSPYSHQYNFSWEPAWSNTVRLQFGYVGSRTMKLLTSWGTNRAVPVAGIPQTISTVNQRRPDPDHFLIQQVLNGSQAWYDAARISAILRATKGWSMDASYWFSKTMDAGADYSSTGASFGAPSQSDRLIQQDLKAVSNFHQPHAFLARVSYDMPALIGQPAWLRMTVASWRLGAVLLLKSGTPVTVFAGSDAPGFGNVDGESGDRVHLLDPSILGRTIGDPDTSTALLPRSAFTFMQPTEMRGNLGRNTFRKGGIRNLNAAVSRSWRFGSERSLTFRAESINLLNTPQFADPERNLVSKTFARITNTLNEGRNFQFTLRFDF